MLYMLAQVNHVYVVIYLMVMEFIKLQMGAEHGNILVLKILNIFLKYE